MTDDPILIEVRETDISIDAFEKLAVQAATYLGAEEVEQLKHAYEFAKSAHRKQFRKTGEPYINHPVQVALILAELRMDVDTITAALLHDTVEDDPNTELEDVEKAFNENVRDLVDGVTKISRIEVESLS